MTMYLLKFDPQALTLEQVPESEAWADPDCEYIHTESMAVEVPYFRGKGIEYVSWQHPDWTPPPPPKAKRRPWIIRLLRGPYALTQYMRAGLPFWPALQLTLVPLNPWPGGNIARVNADTARGLRVGPELPPPNPENQNPTSRC